jgi:hypothetical protein
MTSGEKKECKPYQVATSILEKEGYKGFYKGFLTKCAIRSSAPMCLVVFD